MVLATSPVAFRFVDAFDAEAINHPQHFRCEGHGHISALKQEEAG